MTPEEAEAFTAGEFRGMVITKLDFIQREVTEFKEDHQQEHKALRNGRQNPVSAFGWLTLLLGVVAASGTTAGIILATVALWE